MLSKIYSVIKTYVKLSVEYFGYEIKKKSLQPKFRVVEADVPYKEREEYGASCLETKLENLKQGLPFECADIVNLNHAVALLIEDEKRIVELGSGTGKFAREASLDASRFVLASEFDAPTYRWCLDNVPPKENLQFINGRVDCHSARFDLSVSIEVVEHIKDYCSFLMEMSHLAPRSLITTPNRKRGKSFFHNGPPNYFKHVREWTAGEFYWVLRSFWNDVRLYGLTSQIDPTFIKVDVDTTLSPLIADCRLPITGPFSLK